MSGSRTDQHPSDRVRTPRVQPPGARPDPASTAHARPTRVRASSQRLQRAMFYAHLWLGVLFTVVLLVVGVTGILLNHKRGLGLMPDVTNPSPAPLAASLPLAELATRARAAAGVSEAEPIDRMDVRPDDGYVKVRFDDPAWTEVTLDLSTGRALHVGPRSDVFMEQLHSGELLGKRWVLLTDAAAVALVVLLVSGYWLWLAPRWRRR
ncbi:MAG TPA: PepSY-associated TM helix domain-containing protein [Gemmatimonadaceae bacterium]|nr:PepSY-associated TM helix domain-containing protein [Gemmatimonadaceae bacterium]